ncbi:MAG: zinc-dependent metalloprotease, partial [Candidatus Latescibacterota bacterium]
EARRGAGLRYISDEGARPTGGAHPEAHLWDNSADPTQALRVDMAVRRVALNRLGLRALEEGQPVAKLEEILVPLYMRHRYQLEAVSKLVAGVDYEYAVAGGEFVGPTAVAPELQRDAVEALRDALQPEELEIPLSLRSLIPPRPPGYPENRELFDGKTGLTFDPLTPAAGLADFVFSLLLDQARMARLVNQHLESPAQPGLDEVLREMTEFTRRRPSAEPHPKAELRRLVEASWVRALIRVSSESDNPPVLASLQAELEWMIDRYDAEDDEETGNAETKHRRWLKGLIVRYLDRDYDDERITEPISMPPGSPIGVDRQ